MQADLPPNPFDENTVVDALLTQFPGLAEIFNGHGMACVGCVFSRFHNIIDVARIYGLDPATLTGELSHEYRELAISKSRKQG
jgi:hybrid cluster-associated redox disulfide protein